MEIRPSRGCETVMSCECGEAVEIARADARDAHLDRLAAMCTKLAEQSAHRTGGDPIAMRVGEHHASARGS